MWRGSLNAAGETCKPNSVCPDARSGETAISLGPRSLEASSTLPILRLHRQGFSTALLSKRSRVSSYLTISTLPDSTFALRLRRTIGGVFSVASLRSFSRASSGPPMADTFPKLGTSGGAEISQSFSGCSYARLPLATCLFIDSCEATGVRTFLPPRRWRGR